MVSGCVVCAVLDVVGHDPHRSSWPQKAALGKDGHGDRWRGLDGSFQACLMKDA